MQRLALAAGRANDLRVYQDGDLTIGVRPGRCYINSTPRVYAGTTGVAVGAAATTHIWLDSAGILQTGTSGLPSDRTTFVPLASVVTDATSITSLTDLRGEAMLATVDSAFLGLTATVQRINEAIDGTNSSVDAAALNTLTGGPTTNADLMHRHLQVQQNVDAEAYFNLNNDSSHNDANMVLIFSLINKLADDTSLMPNLNNGVLTQRYNGTTYNLVGTSHVPYAHEGNLTTTQSGKLSGIVPIDGMVSDVILSLGTNMVSTTGTDGIALTAKVNGTSLTTTDPKITSADGSGTRSTAQGDGTAAVVKSDTTEQVTRGDVLTVDLTRTAVGTITTEAANAVALIVIRADAPE